MFPNEFRQLLEVADIIDEVSDTVTYLGFFDRNRSEDEDGDYCRIMKIETTGNITTRKWADGVCAEYTKNWTNRASYNYTIFRK